MLQPFRKCCDLRHHVYESVGMEQSLDDNHCPRTLRIGALVSQFIFIVGLTAGLISCRQPNFLPCVDNLRNLDLLKRNWANDDNKTTNDVPSWDDLRPYFPSRWSNNIPICPGGGTYRLGRVGEPPTCSIGGPEHSIGGPQK